MIIHVLGFFVYLVIDNQIPSGGDSMTAIDNNTEINESRQNKWSLYQINTITALFHWITKILFHRDSRQLNLSDEM